MHVWRAEGDMRGVLGLLLLWAGCASPQKIEEGAARHEAEARRLQAQGDYYGAQQEQAAAWRQQRKADARRYGYYYW
jgi:outer membrane murein-binding lipoprotein Lpp